MLSAVLAPSVPKHIEDEVKRYDPNLKIVFNCFTERWEIHRYSSGKWHWVLAWENEDGSFRQLDRWLLVKKLWEMDIKLRYGSMDAYEKYLDEKKAKWKAEQDKCDDHELLCDIKDDRRLWKEAAENFRSGIVNEPPPQQDKKIISYQK